MNRFIYVTVALALLVSISMCQILDERGYNNRTNAMTCTRNNNCTSGYCDQLAGICISPCFLYQPLGNYSNNCYCDQNSDCSSQFCGNYTCMSVSEKFDQNHLGFYCRVHEDCGGSSSSFQSSAWPGSDRSYDVCTQDHCGTLHEFGLTSVCDHTKRECQPSCMIGGCYCTEDSQCNSRICDDFHCKSISFTPLWTIIIFFLLLLIISGICTYHYIKFGRTYLVPAGYSPPVGSSLQTNQPAPFAQRQEIFTMSDKIYPIHFLSNEPGWDVTKRHVFRYKEGQAANGNKWKFVTIFDTGKEQPIKDRKDLFVSENLDSRDAQYISEGSDGNYFSWRWIPADGQDSWVITLEDSRGKVDKATWETIKPSQCQWDNGNVDANWRFNWRWVSRQKYGDNFKVLTVE